MTSYGMVSPLWLFYINCYHWARHEYHYSIQRSVSFNVIRKLIRLT